MSKSTIIQMRQDGYAPWHIAKVLGISERDVYSVYSKHIHRERQKRNGILKRN